MNIYLDIDGVILTSELQPARHVHAFLKYVTMKFPTYWLTTHCKGDATYTVNYLARILDEKTVKFIKGIKPTNWQTSKTEALNWDTPFFWFDDYIFDFEKQDLIKHNSLNSWIEVNLSQNPNQLLGFSVLANKTTRVSCFGIPCNLLAKSITKAF